MDERVRELVESLRARGVDVGGLEELGAELDDQPWHARVKAFAMRQWDNVVGELDETREAARLVQKAHAGELDDVETAKLQAQLGDLARMVPAAVLALAIEAVPVPGTSVVTPFLLIKLGLLPSRWRETYVLSRLRAEADRLRAEGNTSEAAEVDTLRATVTLEVEARELLGKELRPHWDADRDGWDEEDVVAYDEALDRCRGRDPRSRRWYVAYHGETVGPVQLAELPDDLDALVCFERSGWVKRSHLL